MVKRKIRMGTIDGHFLGEFEAEVQTEEEKEEERKRQYPDTTKASYLQYPCHYCGNEFYLINPIRAPNMNPLSIIYDVTDINMVPIIQKEILDSFGRMTGIESYTPYRGRNVIAVTAKWTEEEAGSRVAELMRIPGVLDVQAKVIEHGFAGPRIRP